MEKTAVNINDQIRLYIKYPDMLKNDIAIECGDGWYELLNVLLARIQDHTNIVTETPVVVLQIKEKFGTLRFYYHGGDNYISELVDFAEMESERTCEVCSKPGTMRNDGWMKVRCDECMEKENA